jgi:TP901 family phage tail tape measure protein
MATTQKTNVWIDGSQAGATLTELKKKVNILNREIKDLPRNSDEYKKKMGELSQASQALTAHRTQIRGVADAYKPAQSNLKSLISEMAPVAGVIGVATMAIGGLTAGISSWYNNNKEMEKGLSSLKSLTNASAEDLAFYKKEAIDLGKSTTLSATQVVEAYKIIGGAKPELLANKQALNDVTKETITLAEAAEMDLEPAARAVTGILNQYELSADHTARAVNVLAAGSLAGSAEITHLSDTIDKSGAVLNGYNVGIEESVALAELLAEKNLKGAEAGTQLRNVILTMQGLEALPANAVKQLEKYGVDAAKVTNTQIPLNERLAEMSKVAGDATAMMQIFGKENIVAAKTILGNVDKVEALTDAVTGTNTAYEQQKINNDNLDGDLKSLGSAWEGLTLSMGGASGVFRGVVQVGTDVLNWTSDLITALKEGDTLQLETQFLKFANALTFGIGPLSEMFEAKIRLNDITQEVLDLVLAETEANTVLTESLMKNNEALKASNISEAEKARLQEENESIIAKLNEKYPELTANVDFHKITTEEMNALQKEMNATMVQQAIETAKVAEQEKLLQEIISTTIEKQRLRSEILNKSNDGMIASFGKLMAAWDYSDADENQKKAQKNLRNLDADFATVKKSIESMNLSAGSSYAVHAEMAENARKNIELITKRMEKVTDPKKRKAMEAEIKGLNASLRMAEKANQEALNAQTSAEKKKEEAETKAAENKEKSLEKQRAAQKKHNDNMKKLQDDLNSIIENAEKLNVDRIYEEKLSKLQEGAEKELFILDKTINDKYQKDIEAAAKIAKTKGDIGLRAQEQLALLEQMKAEELESKKAEIQAKYDTLAKNAKEASTREQNEKELKQRVTLEDAILDLKISKAQLALDSVLEGDVQGYRKAQAQLLTLLDERIQKETEAKKSALASQYAQDEISQEEFDTRMEQLDVEHKALIEQNHRTHVDKLKAMDRERIENMLSSMSQVLDIIGQLNQAEANRELSRIDERKDAQISALDEELQNKILSQEEYDLQRKQIEEDSLAEQNRIKTEQAEKEKQLAIVQATIAAALAVVKAAPNPITMGIALAAGAAQVALIASQPIPQFADGGYHNVTGAKDGRNYRAKYIGTHRGGMLPNRPVVLASERGPEYYTPNHLLRNPQVLAHVQAIEAIRLNQFADGGVNMGSLPAGSGDMYMQAIKEASAVNRALLQYLPHLRAKIGDSEIEDLRKRETQLDQLKS